MPNSFRMSSIQFMNNYTTSLNKAYREQAKILEQGDGSSIHRGSDDPVGYSKLLRYNVSASENEQYQKNVNSAISWMNTTDNAASNISDRMKTFSEKTVAAANSYNSEADFQSIAKEMMAQIEQILAVGNTQQGDRYIFSGQKDTTEPFVMSHDTYTRGLAKTLDAKQAAFFKGTSGDDNITLYQMLTLNYGDQTYYLDTQSNLVYTKEFVDEGYKELIAQGYSTINEDDKINPDSTTTVAETYAVGKIGPMTVSQAWKVVNAADESELMAAIQAADINDGNDTTLREALKVLYNSDLSTVENNVVSAKNSLTNSLNNVSELQYNYTFTATQHTGVQDGGMVRVFSSNVDVSSNNGIMSSVSAGSVVSGLRTTYPDSGTPGAAGSTWYEIRANQGSEATEVSWTPYDTSTDALSTTSRTVAGSAWNSSTSSIKSNFVDNLISAVDGYAEGDYLGISDTDSDGSAGDDAINSVLNSLASVNPTEDLAGNITSDQVDGLARSEIVYLAVKSCKNYTEPNFKVADAFTNQGKLRDDVSPDELTPTVRYGLQKDDGTYTVAGLNISFFTVDDKHNVTVADDTKEFTFATIEQQLVTYMGDDNYISMVKMNGANDKTSDIVNLNGNDLFGSDIFDNSDSGNTRSGSAMANNMLAVYTMTNACDAHWLDSDGVTLSDVAHATITVSETTLGSRLQLYNSVHEMLENQNVVITGDITDVSGTDIAQLATRLMEMTTLYNMALALGGRVLPQSLADYL